VEKFKQRLLEDRSIESSKSFVAIPFLVVALTAEGSLALSPGSDSISATVFSLIFLTSAVLIYMFSPKQVLTWTSMFVPLFYSGSVLALIIAIGSSASGIGLVMLLPVVWTALYLEIWQSVVVVGVVVACEYVTSIVPVDLSDSLRVRRVLIYFLVASLIVYAVHEVRLRVARVIAQGELLNDGMLLTIGALEESLRSASVLGHLVDMLNSCNNRDEAYEVIEHAGQRLFTAGGSVSVFDSSKDELNTKCAWGNFTKDLRPFSVDDCWALRSGHDYESKIDDISCDHLRNSGETHTLCRPLLAPGEVIGVLTISFPDTLSRPADIVVIADPLPQTALLFGDQISIWMTNFNLREILRFQSIRDPLTNLFNRRFMEETLSREISKADRTLEEISVIQIDIDEFKVFNDGHGHAVGDAALTAISAVIISLFRDSDVPCRSGGEEFTVILPNCSWEHANSRCEELQRRVAEIRISTPLSRSSLQPPTLSIGIATRPEHGYTSDTLLRSADLALYAAKAGGRNRISRALPVAADGSKEIFVTNRQV
jgi:diguanylate cyclase (GGDEF)-like protein